MMNQPSPTEAYYQLQKMIAENRRPADFLASFLQSGSIPANTIGGYLIDYRECVLLLLATSEGLAWLQRHLADTLAYIRKIAEEASH